PHTTLFRSKQKQNSKKYFVKKIKDSIKIKRTMKLDILAFGAHPDDVELGCGATVAKEISLGKKVGIVDLTRGELGTRGSAEIREDRKSTRLNSSHVKISYAVFCLKKKRQKKNKLRQE